MLIACGVHTQVEADEEVDAAVVDLTPELAASLLAKRRLADPLAADQDFAEVSFRAFGCRWVEAPPDAGFDYDDWVAADDRFIEDRHATDNDRVHLTRRGAYWTADLKNSGVWLRTRRLAWAAVEAVAAGRNPFGGD